MGASMAAIVQASAVEHGEQATSPLEERRVLEEVQRFARSFVHAPMTRRPGRNSQQRLRGPEGTRHFSIDGVSYCLYAERVTNVVGQPVIVVTVERRSPEYPLPYELKELFGLTPSEARVALLLASRKSNREIARELGVSEHTARRHTEKVLLKLNLHRRSDVQRALLQCRSSTDARHPPGHGDGDATGTNTWTGLRAPGLSHWGA